MKIWTNPDKISNKTLMICKTNLEVLFHLLWVFNLSLKMSYWDYIFVGKASFKESFNFYWYYNIGICLPARILHSVFKCSSWCKYTYIYNVKCNVQHYYLCWIFYEKELQHHTSDFITLSSEEKLRNCWNKKLRFSFNKLVQFLYWYISLCEI